MPDNPQYTQAPRTDANAVHHGFLYNFFHSLFGGSRKQNDAGKQQPVQGQNMHSAPGEMDGAQEWRFEDVEGYRR